MTVVWLWRTVVVVVGVMFVVVVVFVVVVSWLASWLLYAKVVLVVAV